jgi:hypothetical protein
MGEENENDQKKRWTIPKEGVYVRVALLDSQGRELYFTTSQSLARPGETVSVTIPEEVIMLDA